MNVTIKLDNGLCREARHRAVDRGQSLSGMKEGEEQEFEVPRDPSEDRDPLFR